MTRSTFRLILLVSCAHALVHVFELALPSVEQMIGEDFRIGKDTTGMLGMAWRLPFGLGALGAGWLADRLGSRRMLIVYLAGCIITTVLAATAPTLAILFGSMFLMGSFASIYHPAGLSLISRVTTPETRGRALGWHGIFGSIGITAAPLGAAVLFSTGWLGWRGYYLLLIAPAAIIAILISISLRRGTSTRQATEKNVPQPESTEATVFQRGPFLLLVASGALSGFVYGAFLHFLQRYLDGADIRPESIPAESFRNYMAALTLLFAVVGQAIAGRMARPGRLEPLQVLILLGSIPCLVWMAVAEGWQRPAATCCFALIHFMTQPVYNSLIAQLVPPARRSTGYGFSNLVCFGLGGLGPWIVGQSTNDRLIYSSLAGIVASAALLATLLWWMLHRGSPTPVSSDEE